jgi:transcriptional regulator with XRE-family HTH domain
MNSTLGKFLIKYRKNKDISQRALAKLCNISHEYIGKLEKDKAIPTIDILLKLSQGLNISIINLLISSGYVDTTDNESINSENIIYLNDGDFFELFKEYKASDLTIDDLKEIIRVYAKIKKKHD